jgi:hypothetical protein
MNPRFEILYCHVRRNAKHFSPGHWFFDTGQWAACGHAGKDKAGKWHVHLCDPGKYDPEHRTFDSINDVLKFVSDFFGRPVRKVTTRELPRAEDL